MSFTVDDVATPHYELRAGGALTDADVTLTVTTPTDEVRHPAVIHVSQGVYEADVLLDAEGVWLYRWQATGAAQDAEVGRFVVGADTAPRWAPTAGEVRDEIPGRNLRDYSDAKIDDLVRQRARSLAAELPADLAAPLQAVAHDYLLYSVASIIEDRLFPEQSAIAGSNAQRLDQRAGAELARLRGQLDTDGTGDSGAWSGTVSLRGGGW